MGALGPFAHVPLHLLFGRSGIGKPIQFTDHDERKFLDHSEIQAFRKGAGGRPAIPDPGHGDSRFFLLLETERHASHDRNERSEHGGRGDDAPGHAAEMIVVLPAATRPGGPPQVLEEDFPGGDSAGQHGTQVPDHGADDIVGTQCQRRGAGRGFLAQAAVDAAHGVALAEELD